MEGGSNRKTTISIDPVIKQNCLNFVQQGLVCQFNHKFQYIESVGKSECISCKIKVSTANTLTCEEKCMTICHKCAAGLLNSKGSGSQISDFLTCNLDHPLMKTYKVYKEDCFICNICRKKGNSSADGVRHCYPCQFDMCKACETGLKKCEAEGYYEWCGSKDPMKGNFVIFKNGIIHGSSNDAVGKAKWTGLYSNGDCLLTKQYLGRHKVMYFSKLIGSALVGIWEIESSGDKFQLNFSSDFFADFPNQYKGKKQAIDLEKSNEIGEKIALNFTKEKEVTAPSNLVKAKCLLCQGRYNRMNNLLFAKKNKNTKMMILSK